MHSSFFRILILLGGLVGCGVRAFAAASLLLPADELSESREESYRFENRTTGFAGPQRTRHTVADRSFTAMATFGIPGDVIQFTGFGAGIATETIYFSAPPGDALSAGRIYEVDGRQKPESGPRMWKTGAYDDGYRITSSQSETGAFQIHRLVRSAEGKIESAAISYWSRDAARSIWRTGEIKYRVPQDFTIEMPSGFRAFSRRSLCAKSEPVWLGSQIYPEPAVAPGPVLWSVVSGPGAVEFATPSKRFTSATLSAPGVYVLRLSIGALSQDLSIEQTTAGSVAAAQSESNGPIFPRGFEGGSGDEVLAYSGHGRGQVTVASSTGWEVIFDAPAGEELKVGEYERSYPAPGGNWTPGGGMEVYLPDLEVDYTSLSNTQRFTIEHIEWSKEGTLLSLSVRFEQSETSATQTLALHGMVHYLHDAVTANTAPTVTIDGPAVFVKLYSSEPLFMEAHATDDHQPYGRPVLYQWEVVSGPVLPGYPTHRFTLPQRPRTGFVPFMAGRYRLRVTATDGGGLYASAEKDMIVGFNTVRSYQGPVTFEGFPQGIISLRISPMLVFSGKIRIGSFILPFAGNFTSTIWTRIWPLVGGGTLTLKLTRSGGTGFTGSLSGEGLTVDLNAEASMGEFLSAAGETLAEAGAYTFLLGGDRPPDAPFGTSFGRMILSKTGTTRLTGVLADGTPFSCASAVDFHSKIAFSVTLYGDNGSLDGIVSLAEANFGSPFVWDRASHRSGRYRAGFTQGVAFVAARWQTPRNGTGIFSKSPSSTSGNFEIAHAEQPLPNIREFSLSSSHHTTFARSDDQLTLGINPRTGLLNGSFVESKTVRRFRGAVLQGSENDGGGGGFYLTEDYSGLIELEAFPAIPAQ